MMLITECMACQIGDHDHHHRVVQAVPEGMLGGAICPCEGECRDRFPGVVERQPKAVLPALADSVTELFSRLRSSEG